VQAIHQQLDAAGITLFVRCRSRCDLIDQPRDVFMLVVQHADWASLGRDSMPPERAEQPLFFGLMILLPVAAEEFHHIMQHADRHLRAFADFF
jgi:hypothetical protein